MTGNEFKPCRKKRLITLDVIIFESSPVYWSSVPIHSEALFSKFSNYFSS